jgi:hypothetical protein
VNLRAVDCDDDGSTFAFRFNLGHGSTLLVASHKSIVPLRPVSILCSWVLYNKGGA